MNPSIRSEKLYRELPGMFMVLAVSEVLIQSACLAKPGIIPWAWALFFLLAAAAPQFITSKKSSLKAGMMSSILLVLPFVGAMTPLVAEAFTLPPGKGMVHIVSSLQQLAGYLSGTAPLVPENLQTIGINAICCFSALLFIWFKQWKKRNIILGIAMVFGALRWGQYIPEMDGTLMFLALAWCFSAAVEGPPVDIKLEEPRYKGLLTVSLLITVGVFIASEAMLALFPLDSLNRWAGGWVPTQEIFRNEYTKYGQSGFQLEDTQWYPLGNRLGGAVALRKEPVMQVYTSRPGLYLRGMVKTTYTGQAWEAEPLILEPVGKRLEMKGTGPFVMNIHPFNNRDRTVFAPLHADKVTAEDRDVLMGNDELYRLGFMWFPTAQSAYRVEGFSEVSENTPLSQTEPYLQLPEISSALRSKTEEIAGNGTDTDKMKRLTDWLKDNGTYRLDVEVPSEAREFVEQFVMGSREGYCTYFATALAVMGRISGVPTRYVEGYLLPNQASGRQTYTVTSDRAHAWVEAYISGEGWVAYEPTPGFGNGAAGVMNQPVIQEDPLTIGPVERSPDTQVDKGSSAAFEVNEKLLSAVIFMLVLAVGRVLWVEHCWRKGASGPLAEIWRLYAVLSVLTLIMPEIKGVDTPTEKLKAAASNFTLRALGSHVIIKGTNRLLYGSGGLEATIFKDLLPEVLQECKRRQGLLRYLYSRYGSLALFNSYESLIRHRHFRKENNHGADQPHTSSQS